jgi:glycosyltransferase involved in cell wall biosynthesis
VLVGPARAGMDLTRLESCANVYLLGNKDVAELPAYIKGMDVTLIPYRVNEATRNIYPLKLQEYLATGKPVVSSPMPAVLPYGGVVYIGEGPEDWAGLVVRALREDNPERRAARQAVARENSWDRRVEEKAGHVLRLLEAKGSTRERQSHDRRH